MKVFPLLRIFKKFRKSIFKLKRSKTAAVPVSESPRNSAVGDGLGHNAKISGRQTPVQAKVSASRKSKRTRAKKKKQKSAPSHIPTPEPDSSGFCSACRRRLALAIKTSSTAKRSRATTSCPSYENSTPEQIIDSDPNGHPQKKEMDEKQLQELNRLRRHYEFLKQQQLHLQEAARTILELLHGPDISLPPRPIPRPSAV
ncbi:hypothetical protein VKT23_011448 [Stygiomarasmius scandens]|uniref:Uncharacterized protein n=1 Tax=Marasmiellus scandens TaxID=2682957 RepID=A0ABR1J8A4_9AGAR